MQIIRFVLGRLPLAIDDTCNILSESLSSIETPIVVLADASYDYALGKPFVFTFKIMF